VSLAEENLIFGSGVAHVGKRNKKKLAGDLAAFLRSYGRKAPRRGEPNDRGYNREFETKLKRMRPEEIDALLREEDEGVPPSVQSAKPEPASDDSSVSRLND
jgi:hypothetical protein